MARHHHYSKRSRESRKAMTDGADDTSDYPEADESVVEGWQAGTDEQPEVPPGPAG